MNGYALKTKLYLLTSLFVIVLVLQWTISMMASRDVIDNAHQLSAYHIPLMDKSREMQVAVIQVQQWLTDISATRGRDGLNDGFDEAEKNALRFRGLIHELIKIDPANQQKYEKILPVFNNYYETGKRMAQAYIAGGPEAGNQLMTSFDNAAAGIYQFINQFVEDNRLAATTAMDHQVATTQEEHYISLIFLSLLAAMILLMNVGFNRFVLRPIRNMLAMSRNLASANGDLTQRLQVPGKDEISQLAEAINCFIVKIDNMVSEIKKSVVRLQPMSEELSEANHAIQERTEAQQQTREQVSGCMERTQESAHIVDRYTTEISRVVAGGQTLIADGHSMVEKTTDNIVTLADDIAQASEAIGSLKTDSDKIESVIDVITSIAEQTNLLALNAAIEAARAGEYGRGFAVVADEVRSLASRTRESTVTVQSMIQAIQSGTQEVVSVMAHGKDSTTQCVEHIEQVRNTLNDITAAIGEINQSSENIVAAVQVQNENFGEVADNLSNMNVHYQSALETGTIIRDFDEDILKLSKKLMQLVGSLVVTDHGISTRRRSMHRPVSQGKAQA